MTQVTAPLLTSRKCSVGTVFGNKGGGHGRVLRATGSLSDSPGTVGVWPPGVRTRQGRVYQQVEEQIQAGVRPPTLAHHEPVPSLRTSWWLGGPGQRRMNRCPEGGGGNWGRWEWARTPQTGEVRYVRLGRTLGRDAALGDGRGGLWERGAGHGGGAEPGARGREPGLLVGCWRNRPTPRAPWHVLRLSMAYSGPVVFAPGMGSGASRGPTGGRGAMGGIWRGVDRGGAIPTRDTGSGVATVPTTARGQRPLGSGGLAPGYPRSKTRSKQNWPGRDADWGEQPGGGQTGDARAPAARPEGMRRQRAQSRSRKAGGDRALFFW